MSYTLTPGKSAEVMVHSELPWNDTRIDLVKGETYTFKVFGEQIWQDASIPCTADGYDLAKLRIFERFRRVSDQNWFKLIGTIRRSLDNTIVIGTGLESFTPSVSGRLYCFANDLRLMYCNNHGAIRLVVSRR